MASSADGPSTSQLSEKYVQDSFHSYLKSSLAQAKAERLLDADLLASAEGDLMITGAQIMIRRRSTEALNHSRARFMPLLCCIAIHNGATFRTTSSIIQIPFITAYGTLL